MIECIRLKKSRDVLRKAMGKKIFALLHEKLLKEVALLKPNFKDVNDLKNVATFEPIYTFHHQKYKKARKAK